MSALVALVALLGIAPWAIYVGSLAKYTELVNAYRIFDQGMKQTAYMLMWYEVSAEFLILVVIAGVAAAGLLRRSSQFLQAWLAINTTLIIISTTSSIIGLQTPPPQPYQRALVAGQIITGFWNFVLTVVIGWAASADDVAAPSKAAENAA